MHVAASVDVVVLSRRRRLSIAIAKYCIVDDLLFLSTITPEPRAISSSALLINNITVLQLSVRWSRLSKDCMLYRSKQML